MGVFVETDGALVDGAIVGVFVGSSVVSTVGAYVGTNGAWVGVFVATGPVGALDDGALVGGEDGPH